MSDPWREPGELSTYLRGWRSYFGFCQTPSALRDLDRWIRRRLRCVVWKQWKHGRRRYMELRRLDVNPVLAARAAGSARGPWRISNIPALCYAMPNAFFDSLGLPRLAAGVAAQPDRTAVYGPVRTLVWEG